MANRAPTFIVAFLLGTVFSFGAAEALSPARQLDRLIDEVHEDVDDLRSLTAAVGSTPLRRQLNRELNDLDGSVLELQAALDAIHGPSVPAGVGPQEFSSIYSAVAAESFGDDQLAVLRSASRNRRFSSAQVSSLMQLFSFSDDRIEAAVMLYPQVSDPQNWYTVYGALTFSSDKDALRQRTR